MISIAKNSDFELFERVVAKDLGWRNLKLVRSGSGHPKRNWWLAWNGRRMAKSRDHQLLVEHHPTVADWVIDSVRK